ncbi:MULTISPECIES: gamma-glutamyltransferase [Methylobacterium]|uniref:Glutathione hydrolase proenzyme n=1 Tax=Methylobacterium jeotgali TaxID=381630 RepID=A0ABQ4SZA1_9HYPH|nr:MULTISPECIES: gamma-glutamyltransferase [Methylobacterium]PIU07174.1 MAG: gamma-glutamyltransferase [Methylobacterium sp. CG09_land_8_20_14_0_10_71_15]PIU12666.1 MAG: gamma-glutamyltransferase [Methylobacterium sp. CG08_land_8_20_14_0_20_71_15]GJE08531.1 Glutathione hydrolase proenzyme [Methylobacterium jeotgali]
MQSPTRRPRPLLALALALLTALPGPALAQNDLASQFAPPGVAAEPVRPDEARLLPVLAAHGMVSSQEAQATRVGVEILKRGGNAVDAAVAVGFALAVTLPRAGNLGGGGFMLVHLARTGESLAIDYRETAPAGATETMFLDAAGNPDRAASTRSGKAVGVPGTVRGLVEAHRRYGSGKLSLADLIAPAERLAREGIPVESGLADSLPRAGGLLGQWPSSRKVFFAGDAPLPRGATLVQSDLADTLRAIAERGDAAFYEGEIAKRIAAAVREAGGVMTEADLSGYRTVIREPVRGTYRGHEIVSMPPPSSGGVHLIEILNILEGFDLAGMGAGSARALHTMAEAMKPAYADRAAWLGDPARVKVPVAGLTAKPYAESLRAAIGERARPADAVSAGNPLPFEHTETTHFSVVDSEGNAVSNTYTLNFSYGIGLVAEGTGVLLNNEMDDFAAKPGAQNAYGLVGGAANAVAPGARPLSSMSPTFVFKDGKLLLVTGSPGGSRIITTVLQVIVNLIDFRMNLAEAVAFPRIHHQWRPDALLTEEGLSPDTLALLRDRGQNVRVGSSSGSANSVMRVDGLLAGAADPRQRGTLADGY